MSESPRIDLSPPHMSGEEEALVREVFASNFIAPVGPMLARFEAEVAAYTGIPHCLAVNSGTAAMHLALRHLGIGPGDVVLASTLTFIGSVTPVTFLGAEPVFVDSDPSTWNMDPARLAEALETEGDRVKAVVPTDLYGQCADYEAIHALCAPRGIPVVVDSAESMGARYGEAHAGHPTHAAIFSFNGNKIITSSGGGMLASHDAKLIEHARLLSMQAKDPLPYYQHSEIGYNYRMSNVLAAIGLGQLHALDEHMQRRRAVFERYQTNLAALPGIELMPEAPTGRCNRWLTVMTLPADSTTTPEDLRQALEAHNIESRPVWNPMHRQPVFANHRHYGGEVADDLFARGLCLPSGSALELPQVDRVCSILAETLARGAQPA